MHLASGWPTPVTFLVFVAGEERTADFTYAL